MRGKEEGGVTIAGEELEKERVVEGRRSREEETLSNLD